MSIRSLQAERSRLAADLAKVDEAINGSKARTRIECARCGRGMVVSSLTYIQTHWYVEPYGCTGGDYWKEGEGRYVCPKCGHENRLHDRPEVVALKRFFKKIEKTHRR